MMTIVETAEMAIERRGAVPVRPAAIAPGGQ